MPTTQRTADNHRWRIGRQIRSARHDRGLTINQLAQATALTKGFLSQVERDNAQPSVASLVRICEVLGIQIGSLFDSPQPNYVPRDRRTRVHWGGHGVEEWLLSPSTETKMQVVEQLVEPGGGSGDEPYSIRSETEFVHVLSGQLEVVVEDEIYLLKAGDSLTFAARDAHAWRNPGRHPTHTIWVAAPALR